MESRVANTRSTKCGSPATTGGVLTAKILLLVLGNSYTEVEHGWEHSIEISAIFVWVSQQCP